MLNSIFTNSKKVEIDLNGLNTKGPVAAAKLLHHIERIVILDIEGLLVIKDLSEEYNLDFKGCLYAEKITKITNKI